jgi:hypothetical protein
LLVWSDCSTRERQEHPLQRGRRNGVAGVGDGKLKSVADRLCNHPHGFGRRSIGECIAENIWANGPRDTVVFSQIAATFVSSTSFSSMIATGGLYKRQGLLLNRGQVSGTVPPESWPLFRSREVMRKLPTDRFAQIAAISANVASWPDEGSEAASLFRGEMSDRPRVRQCPALI